MSVREYFFLTINNKIHLNANLANFNDNINPSCTFCNIMCNLPPPKENFEHFFLNCPTVRELARKYFESFLQNTGIEWDNNFILLGAPPNIGQGKIQAINTEIATFISFILKHRKDKKIPLIRNLEFEMNSMRNLYKKNTAYRIGLWTMRGAPPPQQ